jgi:hypothetical protein
MNGMWSLQLPGNGHDVVILVTPSEGTCGELKNVYELGVMRVRIMGMTKVSKINVL